MLAFSRSIILCSALLLFPALSSAIEMKPADGSDCFTSTRDIAVMEFLAMFDPSASDTLQMDRRYTICANTTIQIGEPLEPGGVAYQNGDFPLFVFHPNFSVKCGESGSSINNCVLSGGADMLQTLRDNETLASVLPVLPQLVPGLPAYPTELPTGWMPSADNLRIEGLTFQGGKDLNDGFAHADVIFTGPGSNTTLTDCIFQNSDPSSPPSAGIMSLYYEEFHSDPDAGPYIDLTISECIFRDNHYQSTAIWTTFCTCTKNPLNALPKRFMKTDVLNNRICDNVVTGRNTSTLVWLDGTTKGMVMGNCFHHNNVTSVEGALGPASLVDTEHKDGQDPGVSLMQNYAYNNLVTGEKNSCSGHAISEIPANVVFSEKSSLSFDFKSCTPIDATSDTCPRPGDVVDPAPGPSTSGSGKSTKLLMTLLFAGAVAIL